MYWGQRWGLPWGLIEKYLRSTVTVRLIQGTYMPCRNCRWYGTCVVPKRDHLRGKRAQSSLARLGAKRMSKHGRSNIYVCEDYTEKHQKARF